MSYLFNTAEQQAEMLQVIGVRDVEELFEQIPVELRRTSLLNIPPALSEISLEQYVSRLARKNMGSKTAACFMGGGAYDHFIPAVVDEITGRGEYYTAYTPYQPEASQGTLQAFFEYQTMMCQLTGLDVSNASLYEGGTAVTEAILLAMRAINRYGKVIFCGGVHPEYVTVTRTNTAELKCSHQVTKVTEAGTTDLEHLKSMLDDQVVAVVLQQPNFFGCIEEAQAIVDLAHQHGALAIVSFDPISLGVLKRPGDYGADIAVGEGQSLGVPLQFGGPYLGMMTCRKDFMRKMPGRLVGTTKDRLGRDCFVLNLQAREQHIRRDKATSNICTNQGLMALRAAVFLSVMGPQGMKEAATLSCQKAHYAAEQFASKGVKLRFTGAFFKECVLDLGSKLEGFVKKAIAAGLLVGPTLDRFSEFKNEYPGCLLLAVTEQRTKEEIDQLVSCL